MSMPNGTNLAPRSEAKCQADGTWSFLVPLQDCTWSHCMMPLIPPPESKLKLFKWNGLPIAIGNVATYVCQDGMSLPVYTEANFTVECGPGNAFIEPVSWPTCLREIVCPPPPSTSSSPQVGYAVLEDPGYILGPCYGRNSTLYQPIPGCDKVTVLVEDQYFEPEGQLITLFKLNISVDDDNVDLFMSVVLSHEVEFDLIQFQNQLEGLPGSSPRRLQLKAIKLSGEQSNYLSFNVTHNKDDKNDVCLYSVQCSFNETEFDVTNSTVDGSLDMDQSMKYGTRLAYYCGNSSMFDVYGNGSLWKPAVQTTCQRNGLWNMTSIPTCQYTGCSEIPIPPTLNDLRITNTTLGPFEINDTIVYMCNNGKLFRNNYLETEVVATCLNGNTWHVPTWPECTETVHCEPPPSPPGAGVRPKILSTGYNLKNVCLGDDGPESLEHIGCFNPIIRIVSNTTRNGRVTKNYVIDLPDLDESHENIAALMTFTRAIERKDDIYPSGWGTTTYKLGKSDTIAELVTGFEDSTSPSAKRIYLRTQTNFGQAMPCLQQLTCSVCSSESDCELKIKQLDVFSTHDLTKFGSHIEYQCQKGQKFATSSGLQDTQSMKCTWDRVWTPSKDLRACVVVGCVDLILPNPNHNYIHPTLESNQIWSLGSNVTISCPYGHEFTHNPTVSHLNITCSSSGSWIYPATWPYCVLKGHSYGLCHPPPTALNGIKLDWNESNTLLYPGTTVIYTCPPGFLIKNAFNEYSKSHTETCGWDLKWSPSIELDGCVRFGCAPAPEVRWSALLHPFGELSTFEVATYDCIPNYHNVANKNTRRFTLECLPDGSYNLSTVTPICVSYQFCVKPLASAPIGGYRHWNGNKHYLAEASYTCGPYRRFYDPSVTNLPEKLTSVCQWDGKWTINFVQECIVTHCKNLPEPPTTSNLSFVPLRSYENLEINPDLIRRFPKLPLEFTALDEFGSMRDLFLDGTLGDSLKILLTDSHHQPVFMLVFRPNFGTCSMESVLQPSPEDFACDIASGDVFSLTLGFSVLKRFHVFEILINGKYITEMQVPKTTSMMQIKKIAVIGNSSLTFAGLRKKGHDPMIPIGTQILYNCAPYMTINGTLNTSLQLSCNSNGWIQEPTEWPTCVYSTSLLNTPYESSSSTTSSNTIPSTTGSYLVPSTISSSTENKGKRSDRFPLLTPPKSTTQRIQISWNPYQASNVSYKLNKIRSHLELNLISCPEFTLFTIWRNQVEIRIHLWTQQLRSHTNVRKSAIVERPRWSG
ncbi:uncharacterized protein LOC131882594 [Tigriopus californicus]|uniref:uncharacterized protein LOC131882594 n=1 Tax=Tigriopus californicus TaxID=6832 RepID=UPI0027DA8E37|nr:uncharacterized protein LOC131882594 [Tigriopus californicus]